MTGDVIGVDSAGRGLTYQGVWRRACAFVHFPAVAHAFPYYSTKDGRCKRARRRTLTRKGEASRRRARWLVLGGNGHGTGNDARKGTAGASRVLGCDPQRCVHGAGEWTRCTNPHCAK